MVGRPYPIEADGMVNCDRGTAVFTDFIFEGVGSRSLTCGRSSTGSDDGLVAGQSPCNRRDSCFAEGSARGPYLRLV